jgi:actin-like ATPase involved in cell morphogenesis
MGLFSFTQEIAMDLGTANTIILNNLRSLHSTVALTR